jgi:hypothetical protein
MNGSVIVWDLETVPDLRGFAAANGLSGKTDEEVREAIGDKFPNAGCPFDTGSSMLLVLGEALAHFESISKQKRHPVSSLSFNVPTFEKT